jgi:hypothetical protein
MKKITNLIDRLIDFLGIAPNPVPVRVRKTEKRK